MTTKIIGTGQYLPETIMTNDDLARIVDTSDAWIRERTGIKARRIDTEEGMLSMAVKAAEAAIADAAIDRESIDMIIVATSTPEVILPNCACMVQKQLGIGSGICYDLNAACTGFMYALQTAHAFIVSGMAKRILLIGAEDMSKIVDWSDRGTCILFGDGAGAVIVEASEQGVIAFESGANGGEGDAINYSGSALFGHEAEKAVPYPHLAMNGRDVFAFAVRKLPEIINELLQRTQTAEDEVKAFLLHQANERIIQSVAKRLKIAESKFPMNMDTYGNTSAASIPILLNECKNKQVFKPGDKIVLAGFGAGLTWSAALLTW